MSEDFYDRTADQYIQQTIDANMAALYAEVLPSVRPGGLILDAGCGSGRDSRAFLDRGFRVVAFDASHRMAAYASAFTGLSVECKTFGDVDWEGMFDGIWCCASLLHVPADKFAGVCTRLLRALKPGGVWSRISQVDYRFRCPDRGIFFINHGVDDL